MFHDFGAQMPLLFQKMIYRTDLQAHPERLYVFGDNMQRWGKGGQAEEMRGEPNAIGIVTKKAPKRNDDAYMTDDEFEANFAAMKADFEKVWAALRAGTEVVFPTAKLGSDRAELETRAPRTYAALQGLQMETRRIAREHTPEGWVEKVPGEPARTATPRGPATPPVRQRPPRTRTPGPASGQAL
jgi:hypothetical protein